MEDIHNYSLTIEYDSSTHNAVRSFDALSKMIQGYSIANAKIISSLDPNTKTKLIITNLEYSSFKSYLTDVIINTDEQEIKDKGYKAFLRQGMIEARKVLINALNTKKKITNRDDLEDIKKDLSKIEQPKGLLGIEHIPDTDLLECIGGISSVNDFLEKDQNAYLTQEAEQISLTKDFIPPIFNDVITEYTEIKENMSLRFYIKKPDYIGNSKWDLVDTEGRPFSAKIHDTKWLEKFQNHQLPQDQFPYPQDILHAKGSIEVRKNVHGVEIDRIYTIKEILGVTQSKNLKNTDMIF